VFYGFFYEVNPGTQAESEPIPGICQPPKAPPSLHLIDQHYLHCPCPRTTNHPFKGAEHNVRSRISRNKPTHFIDLKVHFTYLSNK
jgi:hypothetical protein